MTDVLCTAGPEDRPYEERHTRYGIAVVVSGSFGYRSTHGRELLTPGSLLLGNAGEPFECGHEHGRGDRCVAFRFQPPLFERLAADAGARAADRRFRIPRLPPLRALAPLVARAAAGIGGELQPSWEELGCELAARAVEIAAGLSPGGPPAPPGAERKVAAAVHAIEREPAADHTLASLAREAGLSPYHFLRTFERIAGATPHQFVLRARLRAAALALAARSSRVLDVAYGAGFGDLSNFNRAFKAEFGASPTAYAARRGSGEGPRRAQRDAGGTMSRNRA